MDPVTTLRLGVILSAFKLLLLKSYRSTDFEVHRNWLAITHSKNISQWYYEDTSKWTLDYPPLFAYFEYALSHIAKYFDEKMLVISEKPYESDSTILFQKLSVIVTDWIYIYAAYRLSNSVTRNSAAVTEENWKSHAPFAMFALLVANFGLYIVDHIHFQYNGFLFGILLLSVYNMMTDHPLWSAFWFTCLLCLKHIYLYMAPAYIAYLLRTYLFTRYHKDGSVQWTSFSSQRAVLLTIVKLVVYAVTFGPFIYLNQMPQVLSRLFPFKRGLSHAYWAPNFWALYNFADKVLVAAGQRLGLLAKTSTASMTGGLVREYRHTVLPSITPTMTLIITLLAVMPVAYRTWRHPSGGSGRGFLKCLTICAYCGYMFGWHVHEKAILMVIIPLSISAVINQKDAEVFKILAPIGHFSLFPLIFTPQEVPTVLSSFLIHTVLVYVFVGSIHRSKSSLYVIQSVLEQAYLLLMPVVYIYWLGLHQYLGFGELLSFLPLMLISVYCAVGITYCWLRLYGQFLSLSSSVRNMPKKKRS